MEFLLNYLMVLGVFGAAAAGLFLIVGTLVYLAYLCGDLGPCEMKLQLRIAIFIGVVLVWVAVITAIMTYT